jgi:hypothetical protein
MFSAIAFVSHGVMMSMEIGPEDSRQYNPPQISSTTANVPAAAKPVLRTQGNASHRRAARP